MVAKRPCDSYTKTPKNTLQCTGEGMTQTTETKNKTLVLEAFDTLFNKRDYVAAEKFWSPDYIQHSAHIEPGRDGLFNLIKNLLATLKWNPRRHFGRRRFCHRPRSLFRSRVARSMDSGRRRENRKRSFGRTLGRHPGRSDERTIKKWFADVWNFVR